MPTPTDKQFFYFFFFIFISAVATSLHYYGTAVFYGFAALAVKDGW
jgi:hypothetical protein